MSLLSLQKTFNQYYENRNNSQNISPQVFNINREIRVCEKKKLKMCNIKNLPNLNKEKQTKKYCNYFQSLGKFDQTSL